MICSLPANGRWKDLKFRHNREREREKVPPQFSDWSFEPEISDCLKIPGQQMTASRAVLPFSRKVKDLKIEVEWCSSLLIDD